MATRAEIKHRAEMKRMQLAARRNLSATAAKRAARATLTNVDPKAFMVARDLLDGVPMTDAMRRTLTDAVGAAPADLCDAFGVERGTLWRDLVPEPANVPMLRIANVARKSMAAARDMALKLWQATGDFKPWMFLEYRAPTGRAAIFGL